MRVAVRKSAYTLLATIALLSTSCDQSTTGSDRVDVSLLNSGNYPTTPIDIESLRSPSSTALREAINIGAHTPLPHEFDSRFEFGTLFPYKHYVTKEYPPDGFDNAKITAKNFNAEIPGLVAGWRTFGQRRFWPDYGRNLATFALRFESSSAATNAAQKLAERTPGDTYHIPEYPQVATKVNPPETVGSGVMESWTTAEDVLLYIKVVDPVSRPFEPSESAAISKNFLDKQLPMLSTYQRTPLSEIPNLPMDVDGLLSRTLHLDTDTKDRAVYPAHVALSMARMKKPLSETFADAGVDYMAVGSSHIYRARDAAGAERLSAALTNGGIDTTSLRPAEAPPGLPAAVCYEVDPNDDTFSNVHPQCFVTIGRYVARVVGANLEDTHQRTAAQYKLLAPLE